MTSRLTRRSALAAVLGTPLVAAPFRPAAAQPAPFTIPVILSQTGFAAGPGQDQAASLRAYEKLANRTGGIKGQPLRFAIYDDQSSPQTAVQLVTAALAAKPTIVMGSTLAPATTAMMPFFKDGPILYAFTPIVYPERGSFVFAPSPLVSYFEDVMFKFMRMRGWTRIAFIRTNDASGQDNARSIDAALALPENKPIVTTTKQLFNPADLNIAAQVSAVKSSGAQVLFVSATGAPFGTVLRALSDAGVDLPTFTSATNIAPAFIERFKTYLPTNLIVVVPSFLKRDRPKRDPLTGPIEEFYAAMDAEGIKPAASHAFAWDPSRIVVAGLRALGASATPAQLRDWIAVLHGFPGVLGNYDFRTGDQHGLDDKAEYVLRYDPAAANGQGAVLSEAGGTPLRGVR